MSPDLTAHPCCARVPFACAFPFQPDDTESKAEKFREEILDSLFGENSRRGQMVMGLELLAGTLIAEFFLETVPQLVSMRVSLAHYPYPTLNQTHAPTHCGSTPAPTAASTLALPFFHVYGTLLPWLVAILTLAGLCACV